MTQIEFLDQLGRELDGAAGRLVRDQRRSRFHALLAPAAGLAVVAAIAVAVWPGAPADPEREVAAPTEARSLPEALGVLRRPESDADRGPAAQEGREALVKMLGDQPVFRLVGQADDGRGIVLGATGSQVCVYYPDTEAGGIGCWPAGTVAEGRATGSLGDRLHGVVPDGVATVQIDTREDSRRVPVQDNFFEMGGAELPELAAITFEDADGKRLLFQAPHAARGPVVPVPAETLEKADALAVAPDAPQNGRHLGPQLSDLLVEVAEVTRRVPHPPGLDEDFDWANASRDPQDMGSINLSSDVQWLVEYRAQCMWLRYWLAAFAAGDDTAAAQATQVLGTVPNWPMIRPSPATFERMAIAARNGDAADVAREVAINCVPDRPPRPGP